ncbi:unnamed protein product [Pedinophyceae sp. YPF-701]|nr:unnamed protein product [Pedinophyceae sp. YPF-701]
MGARGGRLVGRWSGGCRRDEFTSSAGTSQAGATLSRVPGGGPLGNDVILSAAYGTAQQDVRARRAGGYSALRSESTSVSVYAGVQNRETRQDLGIRTTYNHNSRNAIYPDRLARTIGEGLEVQDVAFADAFAGPRGAVGDADVRAGSFTGRAGAVSTGATSRHRATAIAEDTLSSSSAFAAYAGYSVADRGGVPPTVGATDLSLYPAAAGLGADGALETPPGAAYGYRPTGTDSFTVVTSTGDARADARGVESATVVPAPVLARNIALNIARRRDADALFDPALANGIGPGPDEILGEDPLNPFRFVPPDRDAQIATTGFYRAFPGMFGGIAPYIPSPADAEALDTLYTFQPAAYTTSSKGLGGVSNIEPNDPYFFDGYGWVDAVTGAYVPFNVRRATQESFISEPVGLDTFGRVLPLPPIAMLPEPAAVLGAPGDSNKADAAPVAQVPEALATGVGASTLPVDELAAAALDAFGFSEGGLFDPDFPRPPAVEVLQRDVAVDLSDGPSAGAGIRTARVVAPTFPEELPFDPTDNLPDLSPLDGTGVPLSALPIANVPRSGGPAFRISPTNRVYVDPLGPLDALDPALEGADDGDEDMFLGPPVVPPGDFGSTPPLEPRLLPLIDPGLPDANVGPDLGLGTDLGPGVVPGVPIFDDELAGDFGLAFAPEPLTLEAVRGTPRERMYRTFVDFREQSIRDARRDYFDLPASLLPLEITAGLDAAARFNQLGSDIAQLVLDRRDAEDVVDRALANTVA